jgi:ABC-type multidrug transport system fused ATPase/permease subunit
MSIAPTASPPIERSLSQRPASVTGKARGELWGFAARYRGKIGVTYGLFSLENVLRLAQPMLIGLAINDLLNHSYVGLCIFIAGQALHMGIRVGRDMYDTRAFTSIYTDRATDLVLHQRASDIDVSVVAARSALAREFVEFFERHVPMIIQALFSLVGAVLILLWYDWVLVLFCLALIVPSMILNFYFGRKSLRLSGLLHDQLEKEVEVIKHPTEANVREHYSAAACWRIKLSDNEALTMGLMETFVMLLMIGALVRFCTQPGASAGDIFAVFRYVLLFITALDRVPMLVNHFSRLRDIGGRMGKQCGKGDRPTAHGGANIAGPPSLGKVPQA